MTDFELRGVDDLTQLAAALKQAGGSGKGLRRELSSSLNRATKHTRAELKDSLDVLPSTGGLARMVQAGAQFTTSTTTGATSAKAGVRIRGRRRGIQRPSLRLMNEGRIRHPVFGNRSVWVDQAVDKGFLDEAFQGDRPELQQAVIGAIRSIRSQIYRKV